MRTNGAQLQANTLDFWIAGIIIVLSCSFWIPMKLKGAQQGEMVTVMQNGKIKATYSLTSEQSIRLADVEICIHDGGVFVVHSNCPHQICVKSGRISRAGQTLVCVPNKVLVEITGRSAETQLNAVSY